MCPYLRCLPILAVALLAACNRSPSEPTASPMPAATAPLVARTAPATAGTSATPLPTPLDWNNLASQVGKYQNQIDLFNHGSVSMALRELMGDKLAVLKRNLEVAGPLQRSGDVYYLTGNAPHQGGSDQAYLLIDPSQRALEVGLWQAGRPSTRRTPDSSIAKPANVQRMIHNASEAPAGSTSGPPTAMPSAG